MLRMTRKVSVAEAKGKLPSILREVEQGARVEITRHGIPVAVMIPTGDYERLKEKGRGFWSDLERVRKAMTSGGVTIEEADFLDLRDTASGRSFRWQE
jgi:prevent-host-death family protein